MLQSHQFKIDVRYRVRKPVGLLLHAQILHNRIRIYQYTMPDLKALNARLQAGIQHLQRGESAAAETVFQEVLNSAPDHADALHLLGLLRSRQERNTEALQLIERAISNHPRGAVFHHNIGGIYRKLGRFEEAERAFRQAIRLKPDYGEAYQALTDMVSFKERDPLLLKMRQLLKKQDLDAQTRSYLHFAMGKALDGLGDYDGAFAHYRRGNRAAGRSFDIARFRRQVNDTLSVYSQRYLDTLPGEGHESEQPVFIVGMPRSGTTLVEQILASHPRVYGAGELSDLETVIRLSARMSPVKTHYPNWLPLLPGTSFRQLGKAYLQRVSQQLPDPDVLRFVDKNPLNFQAIGPLLTMLPRARVIHTRRDPLDTCLSCYFQHFASGQDFSFDLDTLAAFYRGYQRLMDHWQTLFGERILTVSYESLLADQQAGTRRLLAFCELEFDQACLNFFATERAVNTASVYQVRKPLYTTSRNRWVNYAKHLDGLAEGLGVSLEQRLAEISGG